MVKVDQQGDSNLYLETNILEKYLVVVEIFDYKVGGMLEKNHCLCTLSPIYFEI